MDRDSALPFYSEAPIYVPVQTPFGQVVLADDKAGTGVDRVVEADQVTPVSSRDLRYQSLVRPLRGSLGMYLPWTIQGYFEDRVAVEASLREKNYVEVFEGLERLNHTPQPIPVDNEWAHSILLGVFNSVEQEFHSVFRDENPSVQDIQRVLAQLEWVPLALQKHEVTLPERITAEERQELKRRGVWAIVSELDRRFHKTPHTEDGRLKIYGEDLTEITEILKLGYRWSQEANVDDLALLARLETFRSSLIQSALTSTRTVYRNVRERPESFLQGIEIIEELLAVGSFFIQTEREDDNQVREEISRLKEGARYVAVLSALEAVDEACVLSVCDPYKAGWAQLPIEYARNQVAGTPDRGASKRNLAALDEATSKLRQGVENFYNYASIKIVGPLLRWLVS
ncbi:MAG: hypothetical protein HYT76_09390 [Deltaproteobacteria bacterium]|nr:hypothetical protein [Deltaproteobacteria bacterium]